MSTTAPQHPEAGSQIPSPTQDPAQGTAHPPTAPATPPPAPPAPPAPAHKDPRKLSLFLKVSIILLAALSIAAIALLFIGDFDGKFVRILSTFVIFAVFVLLTALDTRLDQRSNWYAPVALIANSYILALVLIVSWMTEYQPFFLGWTIFWKAVLVILVTRVVILCCQLLLGMGDGRPQALGAFAFVTSILAVVSGILFTAPVAIETFDITIPDLYWRIAVAALLLTALGLSITLLLRWSYGASDREAARQRREAERAAQQAAQQSQLAAFATSAQAVPAPAAAAQSVQGAQAAIQQPAQPQPAPAAIPQSAPQLRPWPTFADGRPLPVGPDGQPDFSVPGAPPQV